MDELNQATSFSGLLKRCYRIEVPQIQRDYAQGRESEKDVRTGFLNALHEALTGSGEGRADDSASPMNLDFIYGGVEDDGKDRYFLPLDGQQRLTTLLLLHWYLAWRDEQLDDFQSRFWDGRHSRFSYSVRPSSAEFFDALVCFVPPVLPQANAPVRGLLEDQAWFFLNWRLDPTIQSALTMLDAIHERFSGSSGLYAHLVNEQKPAITFQLLQLEKFGLSDDLYIKMNARGKPLTPFETFKARFEEDLKNLFPDGERRQVGAQSLSVRDYFAHRMDTQWTDLFWSYRSTTNKVFDTEAMNLLWTVAQLSLDPEKAKFISDTEELQDRRAVPSYSSLHDGGWLTAELADAWIVLLDAWSAGGGKITRQLPDSRYFDEEVVFQKAIRAPGALSYAELLQFTAFTLFLTKWREDIKTEELRDWMRVVSNLAANTSYDHTFVFQRCMAGLRKLLPESRRILSHLSTMDEAPLGFSPQQVQEEVLKAKLLLGDAGWRHRIEQAEGHGYFAGQIEFLLDFSGAREVATAGGSPEALRSMHSEAQLAFDLYLSKAEVTFDKTGLVEPKGAEHNSYLWQRALLAVGNYLLPAGFNRSFGVNSASEATSWKRYLRGGGKTGDANARRDHLKSLWDKLHVDAPIEAQLQKVINAATGLEPWRRVMVNCAEAVQYGQSREIRHTEAGQTYLLNKHQMNSRHAELFSYALYVDLMSESLGDTLKPLAVHSYNSVSDSYIEPQLHLALDLSNGQLLFAIESVGQQFRTSIEKDGLSLIGGLEEVLKMQMKFYDSHRGLEHLHSMLGFQDFLRALAKVLTDLLSKSS